jgi:hypothetical protein
LFVCLLMFILIASAANSIEPPVPPSGSPPHPVSETPIETAQIEPEPAVEAEPQAQVQQVAPTVPAIPQETKNYTALIVTTAGLAVIAFVVFMFRRRTYRSEMQ